MTEQEFSNWLEKNRFDTINSVDDLGYTPAHTAALHGEIEVLKIITKLAPETLLMQNIYGDTPAHCVAQSISHVKKEYIPKFNDVFEFLLNVAPLTATAEDNSGKTAIYDMAYSHMQLGNSSLIIKLFKDHPEYFPAYLFNKSKENKIFVKKLFAAVVDDIKQGYDEAVNKKEYEQESAEIIKHINEVSDKKFEEYKDEVKAKKEADKANKKAQKEEDKAKKIFEKNLKKYGKGKGE